MRFSISRQVLTGSSSPKTFPLSSIPKRIVPDPKFAKALTVFKKVLVILSLNFRFYVQKKM